MTMNFTFVVVQVTILIVECSRNKFLVETRMGKLERKQHLYDVLEEYKFKEIGDL